MFWPWKNEEFWRGAAQVLLMLFFLTAAFAFSLPVLVELLERAPEGPVLGLWEPVRHTDLSSAIEQTAANHCCHF